MSIGFKEWVLVCEALKQGRQSLILRKGGIAEGREGFRFEHAEFHLFPTLFHEQLERTVLPPNTPLPEPAGETVRIELWACVAWTRLVTDPGVAQALAPFHILKPEVIEQRFHYDEPKGVNVAFVRVFRLERPWEFPMRPAYGGCRSWVTLPDPPEALRAAPVLSGEAHAALEQEVLRALDGERSGDAAG